MADEVLVRELPRAVAGAGMPVLHVNPVDRTVDTVVVETLPLDRVRPRRRWWDQPDLGQVGLRLPGPHDDRGRLVVDPLDHCLLDPDRGLVTPAMLTVATLHRRGAAERASQRRRQSAGSPQQVEQSAESPQ